MKKTILCTALFSLLIPGASFAKTITVNGAKAKNLRIALIDAGVSIRPVTEVSIVTARDIRCSMALVSMGKKRYSCDMQDLTAKRVVATEGKAAEAIINGILAAGIKADVRVGASVIDAREISCTAGRARGTVIQGCEITE